MGTITSKTAESSSSNSSNSNASTAEVDIANHPIVGDRVIEGDGTSRETWKNWQGLQALPQLNVAERVSVHQRVCVFAPHPDDEIIGSGGLLQQLAANGNPIVLIHVTNGTQSHPTSSVYPPHKLDVIRPQESRSALNVLGIAEQVTTISLNLTDGNVFNEQEAFNSKIAAIILPNDILVTPFMHDGHPDHEATGHVVSAYAAQNNLACYQVLIWAWHWAKPADSRIPWHSATRLDLTKEQLLAKDAAIQCFTSQITADASTGNAPILPEKIIARISQPWEVYLFSSASNGTQSSVPTDANQSESPSPTYSEAYFNALYSDTTDPWQYQTRWYEKRKRDVCLAVLPKAHHNNAIELGCGNGVFSALLADRCQRLLSIDGNEKAVQIARKNLAERPQVKVIQGLIPEVLSNLGQALSDAYPVSDNLAIEDSFSGNSIIDASAAKQSSFDLIIISEILYYLTPSDIDKVITWVQQHLAIDGTLLCCHWRYPIEGFAMNGETVHQRLQQAFANQPLNHQTQMMDSDFLLDVWQNTNKTVAMQEHLV